MTGPNRYRLAMPWVDVVSSDELTPGGRLTVELADRDVVVWRTVSGRVSACDARCPHQWAHLGSAGVVDGEVLVCLSHAWCFDTDGAGFKLSASGRRDEKSPVSMVGVRVEGGRIELDVDGGVIRVEVHAP